MIEEYLNEMVVNGKAENTIRNTKFALEGLHKFKALNLVTKDDLIEYFKFIEPKLSENTFVMKKRIIKKFYKDAGKGEMVEWIKIQFPMNNLDASDLLTTDDVNKLIKTSRSPMYKALIAVLYETGARLSEVLKIEVGDLERTENGMIVKIENIKTKNSSLAKHRRTLLIFSTQYIENYIKLNDNLYLFKSKKEDPKRFRVSSLNLKGYLFKKLCINIIKKEDVIEKIYNNPKEISKFIYSSKSNISNYLDG